MPIDQQCVDLPYPRALSSSAHTTQYHVANNNNKYCASINYVTCLISVRNPMQIGNVTSDIPINAEGR